MSLPGHFAGTRDALHQVAYFALAPARYKATGRMGLQAAPGGFGTPEFGGRVVRVEGDLLVQEQSDEIATQTFTTVRAAAEFVGVEYEIGWFEDFHDPLAPVDPDAPLDVDDTSSRALGDWFSFGDDVLNRHRERGDGAGEVQLWPEHFDAAMDMGRRRASYGASPGDGAHDEPYLYVAPWTEIDVSNAYWNDPSFKGSSLGYTELAGATDPVTTALDFLLEGHRILDAS